MGPVQSKRGPGIEEKRRALRSISATLIHLFIFTFTFYSNRINISDLAASSSSDNSNSKWKLQLKLAQRLTISQLRTEREKVAAQKKVKVSK